MESTSILKLISDNCTNAKRLKADTQFVSAPSYQKQILYCSYFAKYLEKNYLPSGSGFDQGTIIDFDSDCTRVILNTSFHHMDEHGYYDRWTYHAVHCLPEFGPDGFRLLIKGLDYKGIKDYLHTVFRDALLVELANETLVDIRADVLAEVEALVLK